MSFLVMGAAFMMLGAGTFSYFDDTEVSTGNTFTAGTIDIVLTQTETRVLPIGDFDDLKPCQIGYLYVNILNDGTNPLELWKHIYNVDCKENDVVDAEEKYYIANGIQYSPGKNDIDTVINFDLSIRNTDCGEWTEKIPESDDLQIDDVEDHWIYLGVLQPGETMYVRQSFHMQGETGNWAQSDKMTFDEEFLAQQIEGEIPPEPGTVLLGHGRPGSVP